MDDFYDDDGIAAKQAFFGVWPVETKGMSVEGLRIVLAEERRRRALGLPLDASWARIDMLLMEKISSAEERPVRFDDRSHGIDDRPQKLDDRSHRMDDRSRRADDRPQKTDDRSLRADDRPQKMDDRLIRNDDRSQRMEIRPSRSDDRASRSDDRPSRIDERSQRKEDRPQRMDACPQRIEDRHQRIEDQHQRRSRIDERPLKINDRLPRNKDRSPRIDSRQSRITSDQQRESRNQVHIPPLMQEHRHAKQRPNEQKESRMRQPEKSWPDASESRQYESYQSERPENDHNRRDTRQSSSSLDKEQSSDRISRRLAEQILRNTSGTSRHRKNMQRAMAFKERCAKRAEELRQQAVDLVKRNQNRMEDKERREEFIRLLPELVHSNPDLLKRVAMLIADECSSSRVSQAATAAAAACKPPKQPQTSSSVKDYSQPNQPTRTFWREDYRHRHQQQQQSPTHEDYEPARWGSDSVTRSSMCMDYS